MIAYGAIRRNLVRYTEKYRHGVVREPRLSTHLEYAYGYISQHAAVVVVVVVVSVVVDWYHRKSLRRNRCVHRPRRLPCAAAASGLASTRVRGAKPSRERRRRRRKNSRRRTRRSPRSSAEPSPRRRDGRGAKTQRGCTAASDIII